MCSIVVYLDMKMLTPQSAALTAPLRRGAKSPKRCQRQMKQGDFGDIVLQTDRKGKFADDDGGRNPCLPFIGEVPRRGGGVILPPLLLQISSTHYNVSRETYTNTLVFQIIPLRNGSLHV